LKQTHDHLLVIGLGQKESVTLCPRHEGDDKYDD